jgi:uncharacterized protein GlcG (DUF336 family)
MKGAAMRRAILVPWIAAACVARGEPVVNEPSVSTDAAIDGAAPHSAEHSLRKAYTALTYRMPSADYGKRAAQRPGAIGPQLLTNITTAAGGVPIRSGNAVIGAVGVSGTPSSQGGGEGDAKCAEAGIAKVFK